MLIQFGDLRDRGTSVSNSRKIVRQTAIDVETVRDAEQDDIDYIVVVPGEAVPIRLKAFATVANALPAPIVVSDLMPENIELSINGGPLKDEARLMSDLRIPQRLHRGHNCRCAMRSIEGQTKRAPTVPAATQDARPAVIRRMGQTMTSQGACNRR